MNIREYQVEASRTCSDLGEKLNLAHMVLGMWSEFEEYIQAKENNDYVNLHEECSDIMWYIANYCTFRGYDLQVLWENNNFNGKPYTINISTLQDYIKKYIAYNKLIDDYKETNLISNILYNVRHMYGSLDYLESLEKNIAKLKARFPEKFTQEAALNRNLELERKILEGNDIK